jgi:uncharacterized protein DUF6644
LRELAAWMQTSALGHFMRESGAWTYAVVNLFHILGVASLFGSVLVLDLRLMGVGRRIPLAALADATVPVATAGFAVAATTGVGLLATKATEYVGNPFLAIKFPAIALGLINVLALRLSPAWQARGQRELSRRELRQLSLMGGLSLACWLTAITAGRMIAYW